MNNVMQLNFIVNKQLLTRTDSNRPVEYSEDYLIAKFTFSPDWDNATKKVFVQYENRMYLYVDLLEDNTVKIPNDVIKSHGFKLAVQGRVDGNVVITTNTIGIPVLETLYFEGVVPGVRYVESETITHTKTSDVLYLEIPDIYGATITLDNPEDGIVRLKNRAGDTIGQVDLPVEKHLKSAHLDQENKQLIFVYEDDTSFTCDIAELINDYRDKISKLEEWAESSLAGVDEALNILKEDVKSTTAHSLKVSQSKEHIIDLDLLNNNGESISHQEINLDNEHIIDKVTLDYDNKKLIFTFKDGHSLDCDIASMIDDLQGDIARVNARIDALDYYNSKTDGYYIDGITQTGGLVSATKRAFDSELNETSINAPQTKVVKSALEEERKNREDADVTLVGAINTEIKRAKEVESELDSKITSSSSDIGNRLTQEILRANQVEAQLQAKIEIETTNRIDGDTKTLSSAKDYSDSLIATNDEVTNMLNEVYNS